MHYCPRCGFEQDCSSPGWKDWAHAHPLATVFISIVIALFGVFMVAVIGVYPITGWSIVGASTLGVLVRHRYQRHQTAKALAARADWEHATRLATHYGPG